MFRAMSDRGRRNINGENDWFCSITEKCFLTKQRDKSFVSIQVLCHHLLKPDALKDLAADGSKSSLREMHSHHSGSVSLSVEFKSNVKHLH